MRFRGAIVTLLLVVSASAQSLMNEEERLQFADGLLARDMHELALKEYEAFLKDYPASAKADAAHYRMGECHRRLGNRDAADKEFKTVFTDYPQSALRHKAGVRRADLAVDAGRYETAVDLYSAVQRENPPEDVAATCAYFTGEALLKLGKTAEAAKAFEQVKDKHQTSAYHPYALLKLGAIYGEDSAKAEQVLDLYKTVAAKPGSERIGAEAVFQIAELYFKRKDFGRSAESYKKLLTDYSADHRSSESRLQAAWACHNAGLYADALAGAVEALKGAPGDRKPEWLYLQANGERQLLKNEAAIQTYSRLLQEFPDSPFSNAARYEKALTFYKMGKYKEAVDDAIKMKMAPDAAKDAYWLLAECYAELKDEDNAIQYYRLIVRDFPKSDVACDATYRLAHHLQGKGDLKEASRYYVTTAVNFPESPLAPMALFASAVCLNKLNQFEGAIRDWAMVIQKYPTNSLAEESHYQKGVAETRLKQDAAAILSFGALVKKFPQSKFTADGHYWLGMLLKEGGKLKEAEDELRLALQANPSKEIQRETQFQLALLLQKGGKPDEAAGLFQALLASPVQEKFSPRLLQWLAEFNSAKKAHAESLAAARLLVERSQEAAWQQTGWCLAGRASLALGDKVKAEESFRKALDAKANTGFTGEAAFNLAELMLAAGKFDEALKFHKQAAEKASDETQLGVRARAYVGLARAYKGLGDLDNALRYFLSVPILYDDPELVPECLYEAAVIFKKQGKAGESLKVLKELRDRYPDSPWAKKPDPP